MPNTNQRIINEVLRQYDQFKEKNPQYQKLIEIIQKYHEAETSIKVLQIRQKGVFSDMGRNQFNCLIKNQCDTQQELVIEAKNLVKHSVADVLKLQQVELNAENEQAIVDAIVQEYLDVNQVCHTLTAAS